jgi:hypothetical protein
MSNNTIRARVAFSFKGEAYELDSVIDLDQCGADAGKAPDCHLLLAREARIDPYSYQYEVLASHEIEFSDATGLAAQCCRDGHFDWTQFDQARGEDDDWQAVRPIAQAAMGARDPDADPALKIALLAAYRAGKASAR